MSQSFEQGFALVVGVGGDLPSTVRDAERLYEDFLVHSGRCAFPPDQVTLLVQEDATRSKMLEALERLARQVEDCPEDATAIVFFSGHGMKGTRSRLVTWDYDPEALDSTTVSAEEFTDALRAIPAKRLVVLLDCCHAAGTAEPKKKSQLVRKEPIPIAALEEFQEGEGRVVLASSRHGEYSYSNEEEGYGYFTQGLCEALSGRGASEEDGLVRILDVALYTAHSVAEQSYENQHPVLKVANLKQNFSIAYYAGGKTEPAPIAKAKKTFTGPAQSPGRFAPGVALWLKQLDTAEGKLMRVRQEMREFASRAEVPTDLHREEERLVEEVTDLKGRLGTLPEQATYARSITRLWSWLGLVLVWITFNIWSYTQSSPTIFWSNWEPPSPNRYSAGIYGVLLGAPLLAVVLFLTSLYQNEDLGRGLLNRLPVAFGFPLYSNTRLRRWFQVTFLVAFLLVPLAGQVKFMHKLCEAGVYDSKTRDTMQDEVGVVSGWRHFTKPYPLYLFGEDRFRYRHAGEKGPTFFPFWQPWAFLLSEVALFLYFLVVLQDLWRRGR